VAAATVASGLGALAVLRARMHEHLDRVIPFHERHLVVLASPHDGLPPIIGPAGNATGPVVPLRATPMRSCAGTETQRVLGVGGAPHDVGNKNILLASGENLPGLDTEGAFISAWGAVRILLGSQPKRARSRKDILIEDA
jgi:hypothetical protein